MMLIGLYTYDRQGYLFELVMITCILAILVMSALSLILTIRCLVIINRITTNKKCRRHYRW